MPNKSQKQTADKSANGVEQEGRKPYVAPKLRREAGLTQLTADRVFLFSSGGES